MAYTPIFDIFFSNIKPEYGKKSYLTNERLFK